MLGALIEGYEKRKAMTLSLQISSDQRGWQYYAKLFDDFNYGKEIRINGLSQWLLGRERQYFTKVNQNLKKQNDSYIKAGVATSAFMFIQQTAAYFISVLPGDHRNNFGGFLYHVYNSSNDIYQIAA